MSVNDSLSQLEQGLWPLEPRELLDFILHSQSPISF